MDSDLSRNAAEAKYAVSAAARGPGRLPPAVRGFLLFALALTAGFAGPLVELARFAYGSELYSYILLVPFVSLSLIWMKRKGLPRTVDVSFGAASIPLVAGLLAIGGYGLSVYRGWSLELNDYLSLTVFAFFCFLIAGGLAFLGYRFLRALAFPLAFLVFIVPFPLFCANGIEAFLQHTSADAASALFSLTDMPVFRDGLLFRLPGLSLQVARECSGIHSSLVLFITSLLAGYLFLRSPWKQAALALSVIPLAILRNGFRIFTLAYLSVHVNPNIIDSPLHHRGGPIFFALSLAPFFVLLLLLCNSEKPPKNRTLTQTGPPAAGPGATPVGAPKTGASGQ